MVRKAFRRSRRLFHIVHHPMLLSFLLPLLFLLIFFIIRGFAPFGDRELLAIDGWGQYFPMLREAEKQFFSGHFPAFSGITWSFDGILGFDFAAQSAYYTNSPFWILLFLLPGKITAAEIDLMVLFKCGFTGLFFSCFLKEKRCCPEPFIPLFSLAYALSAHTMAFINQLMWMDAVMLLPLNVLGLERIFDKHKPGLYLLTLTLSIWSCFYSAYMVCVFLCLWFIKCAVLKPDSLKKALLLFTACSLLSGIICLPVLIPLAKALKLTIASTLHFSGPLKMYQPFFKPLLRLLPFQKPCLTYNTPNLWCSIFSVLFTMYFFISKKDSVRAKLFFLSLFLFFLLSVSLNILDYLWHGFHYPNQLPARWSFIFIFSMLYTASYGAKAFCDYITARRHAGHVQARKKASLPAQEPASVRNIDGLKKRRTGKRNRPACVIILWILMFLEVSSNAVYLLHEAPRASLKNLSPVDDAVSFFEDIITPDLSSGEFFRTEFMDYRDNAGQLYSFPGISYYSSTMSEKSYRFFQRTELPIYAKNVSTRYVPQEALNALFSVRFLIGREESESPLLTEISRRNGYILYENKAVFPLGFLTGIECLYLDPSLKEDALIKDLMTALTGDWSLYQKNIPDPARLEKDAEKLNENSVKITEITAKKMTGHADAKKDCLLFFTLPEERCTLYLNGKKAEQTAVLNYLLAAEIPAGSYDIEIRFH